MLRRVRFRDRATGEDEWLCLLVLLEFRSTVDRHMAVRVLACTARTLLKLVRGGDVPTDGKLPPVLPVAIYNGRLQRSRALVGAGGGGRDDHGGGRGPGAVSAPAALSAA